MFSNAASVYPEINVRNLDLDYLLYGTPTPQEVSAYFARGEWHEEQYLVEAIEKHLLTEEQRKLMFDHRLTIEKILNGRYPLTKAVGKVVDQIMKEWNEKLQYKNFN